ncbi:MAG TPA: arsenate reductase (glutaredoxin) [Brevundimonas sp.]|jgi:arsenate reductase|uniref:arsenate reductase (glutaredoxin) n=1 Tax=Brevundimonas aurantiaca TaxID=74316 RepID=UPI000C8AAA05|nr:arsenate reductase (glutaredoxin) [Brevundimonas sp.]HAF81187.1 arsenate reductase (glutaredoxin) [Brevundimonas sp.]|tara:strand:- start:41 stop:466 length:426 start_codon:yes stop_codon:yes gene_type:complete
MDIVIYHNPACGTSRNTLALIRHVGIEPHVVEYLKTPPSRALVAQMVERTGGSVRDILREKGTPYAELGLGDPGLSDDQLLEAIEAHPILMNRPIVVSPRGVKLCRPSEAVLDLLPTEGLKPFTKADGEVVIDADGRRVGG